MEKEVSYIDRKSNLHGHEDDDRDEDIEDEVRGMRQTRGTFRVSITQKVRKAMSWRKRQTRVRSPTEF